MIQKNDIQHVIMLYQSITFSQTNIFTVTWMKQTNIYKLVHRRTYTLYDK